MSNTERQRQFRKRNPGYYGRLHRQRNAMVEQLIAEQAAVRVQQAERVAVAVQLMLPAPEQSSQFDGVLLLQQFNEAVARREAEVVPARRAPIEAEQPLHLPLGVR